MTSPDFRALYAPFADAERAVLNAAYMKNRFPFLGIPTGPRRAASKVLVKASRAWDEATLRCAVEELWAMPEREFQYLGTELLVAATPRLGPDHLPWVKTLVERKSWWDTIDTLAPWVVGTVVLNHPECGAGMDTWGEEPDFWVVRVAMLHQLRFKTRTDEARLFQLCLRHAESAEFFLRKGAGWALREHAKTNPESVYAFLDEHRSRFSGLTIREAEKYRK